MELPDISVYYLTLFGLDTETDDLLLANLNIPFAASLVSGKFMSCLVCLGFSTRLLPTV